MFDFVKNIFMGLLTTNCVVRAFSHAKCVSLSNQRYMSQPTIVSLHPNKYTQGLRYYPFVINSDRCVGSCNKQNRRFRSKRVQHNYRNK